MSAVDEAHKLGSEVGVYVELQRELLAKEERSAASNSGRRKRVCFF